MPWPLRYVCQRLFDAIGYPQQGELAQRAEVARPEVVAQRRVDPLRRVDVAVGHPSAQGLRRHVDQLELIGAAHDVVGHRLALHGPGDLRDDVVQRFEVLDVQRRDDVDAGIEQLLDVLPALLVLRPGRVGVGVLVDQRRLSGRRARMASMSISSNVVPR